MDAQETERQIAWMAEQLEAWRRSGEPAAAIARRLTLALTRPAPTSPVELFSDADLPPAPTRVAC
jgi:hypothetical protein